MTAHNTLQRILVDMENVCAVMTALNLFDGYIYAVIYRSLLQKRPIEETYTWIYWIHCTESI